MIEWSNVLAPFKARRVVTPGSSDLPDGPCRALILTGDALLNITEVDGTERDDVPFFKGVNPYLIRKVRTGAGESGVTIEAGY